METLTNTLFWITNGLLIPVIVGLVLLLGLALAGCGAFFDLYMKRRRHRLHLKSCIKSYKAGFFPNFSEEMIRSHPLFYGVLGFFRSVHHDPRECRKRIADVELRMDKWLGKNRVMIRLGPILGLMGTLIPMGPALTGLASGNLEAMAINMQVAFSTTVVGLFVGGVGFILNMAMERWSAEDLTALEYIAEFNGLKNEDTDESVQKIA
jgi:biopolymer transport protein ExbB/TolQ